MPLHNSTTHGHEEPHQGQRLCTRSPIAIHYFRIVVFHYAKFVVCQLRKPTVYRLWSACFLDVLTLFEFFSWLCTVSQNIPPIQSSQNVEAGGEMHGCLKLGCCYQFIVILSRFYCFDASYYILTATYLETF